MSRGRTRLALFSALCAVALAAVSPAANAGWRPRADIGPGDLPKVAVHPSGAEIFAWRDGSGVLQTSVLVPGSGPGAPQDVSGGEAVTELDVAVGATGEAAYVWATAGGEVRMRLRLPSGTLTTVQTVLDDLTDSGVEPRVAVEPDGSVAVVYRRTPGLLQSIETRVRDPAGTLGAAQPVSPPAQQGTQPRLAADGGGNVVYAYESLGQVWTARRESGGGLPLALMAAAGAGPEVAVAASGTATIAWLDGAVVKAARRAPDGTLSAVETISDPAETATGGRVAVDGHDAAHLVWTSAAGGGNHVARTRAWPAGGSPGGAQDLSAAGVDATEPAVATNAGGSALFAWLAGGAVQGRKVPAGRSPEPVADLASGAAVASPGTGMDSSAGGVAAWARDGRVEAAVFDAVAPLVSRPSGRASAELGLPERYTSSASDLWPGVSIRWDFGDGSPAAT